MKWAGIKNTEGGEVSIHAGLDPIYEIGAFDHTFKTMSGPLQLIQVIYYRFLSAFYIFSIYMYFPIVVAR